MYTAVSREKMYACRKITMSSNRVKAIAKRIVPPAATVQPLICQKKKFVALNSMTRMMCPANIFAIRRIVSVTGRRTNVENASIGATMK